MDKLNDEIWITKDGKHIPVEQLTEEHAKAIIRMFLRNKKDWEDSTMIDASTPDSF